MAHLLHIDSSVKGDQSVSRRLTARAAARWRAAHLDGTVTYRDLATDPIPHFTPATGAALSATLIDEIKNADTILLGLPLYNFGPPSTVKAWVDHIVAQGLSIDAEPAQDSSVTPTSWCSPVAAADTVPAHRGKDGTTLRRGCRTPSP